MGIILSLVALAVIFLGGLGVVLLMQRTDSSGLDALAACGSALVLGAGLVSISSFVVGLLVQGIALRSTITGICFLLAILGWKRHHFRLPQIMRATNNGPRIILFTLAAGQIVFLIWNSLYLETLGWDGLFNWEWKARVAFQNGGAIPLSYYAGDYYYFHRTYPLLVPLVEAWIYGFAGQADQSMIKLVGPYFYLAALLFLLSVAKRSVGGSWASILVIIPFLMVPELLIGSGSASSGYADFPLTTIYLCAVVHYLNCWRSRSVESARFLGLSAMLLPFTKQEGMILLPCVAVAVIPLLRAERGWRLVAWAVLPGAGMWLAWFAFLKSVGARDVEYLPLSFHLLRSRIGLTVDLVRWSIEEFNNHAHWSILWPLAAGVFIFLLVKTRNWYPWLATAVLPLCLYPCVYFLTMLNPEAHVRGSIDRLFLHVSAVASLMVGIVFGQLAAGTLQKGHYGEDHVSKQAEL